MRLLGRLFRVVIALLRRPPIASHYRGTTVDRPRPALRIYPTFEKLPR